MTRSSLRFRRRRGALAAAAASLDGLAGGPITVRIGLHTGTPLVTDEGYVGEDVHRVARIAACGHGGQVLVSASTASLTTPSRCLTSASTEAQIRETIDDEVFAQAWDKGQELTLDEAVALALESLC